MIDFLLDDNHDLVFVNNDLALTDAKQGTIQKIKQKLKFIKGEYFLNEDLGIPYYENILVKNPDLALIESIYIRALQEIEEITEIESFNLNFDPQTRNLSVNFEVRDSDNNSININL